MESSEEMQQKPAWQALPVWEWNAAWVDEMEAKYKQQVEDWSGVPKTGKGKATALGETRPLPATPSQEINGKYRCTCVGLLERGTSAN